MNEPSAPHPPDRKGCAICGELAGEEVATQKYGWPQSDTFLPVESGKLTVVRDFRPNDSRALQLRQCPACGTYYLYRTDYTYLAGGSEDEEYLTRLTNDEAAEYLDRPAPAA